MYSGWPSRSDAGFAGRLVAGHAATPLVRLPPFADDLTGPLDPRRRVERSHIVEDPHSPYVSVPGAGFEPALSLGRRGV